MSVRIQSIQVKDIGPINRFQVNPGSLNVFYGRNEQGKTWIVEFLIRSLFTKNKFWKLRNNKGTGRVTISGIQSKPIHFSPVSPKIEDFLNQDGELPQDFSKLLVVKGAELTLLSQGSQNEKVDKQILKEFLSNQGLLDRIQRNISDTIQKTMLVDNVITGPKRGEINKRDEYFEQLQKIDTLFDQITRGYSGGPRKSLEIEKDALLQVKEQLQKAKQYQAWLIAGEIQQLESDMKVLDESALESLRESIQNYKNREDLLRRQRDIHEKAVSKVNHYSWLKNALNLYQSRLCHIPVKPSIILFIVPVLSMIATGLFVIKEYQFYALTGLIASMVTSFLYYFLYNRFLKRQNDREELRLMKSDFESRFKESFTGLSQLQALFESMQQDYAQAQVIGEQIEHLSAELILLKTRIDQGWLNLMGKVPPESEWNSLIHKNQEQFKKTRITWQQKREILAGLQISADDYIQDNPGISYTKKRFEEVSLQLNQIEMEITETNHRLDRLKHLICNETGDTVDRSWSDLIYHLQEKRKAVLAKYQEVIAEIVGKMAVHRVIESMRVLEDEKIAEGLGSSFISEPLKRITGRYHQMRLDGDEIIIMDEFHEFNLSELSTGAQEQVLLALRLGFASHLFGDDKLFLILDDAFQHSDWQRRSMMIDAMVQLAVKGWQILYFTMDDHIRDLFEQKGKILGNEFLMMTIDSNQK